MRVVLALAEGSLQRSVRACRTSTNTFFYFGHIDPILMKLIRTELSSYQYICYARDFDCRFFFRNNFPRASEYTIEAILNFKNLGDIYNFVFVAGINDIGDKLSPVSL